MGSRRIPRHALALDTQTTDRRFRPGKPRQVLLVGELAVQLRTELGERGAVITDAVDTHQAFELLATRDFEVVVINPYAPGNGLDLATALKEPEADHLHTVATLYGERGRTPFLRNARPPDQDTLVAARTRHRITPLVILPKDGTGEFAIVVLLPDASFMEDPRQLPIVTAILTVDAGRLLMTVGAMA